LDDGGCNRAVREPRDPIGRAQREMARGEQSSYGGAFVDDERFELSIVHSRLRRQPDAVPVLAAVRERNQEGMDGNLFPVEPDLVVASLVLEALAKADADIRSEAPAAEFALGVELFRDDGIDAD